LRAGQQLQCNVSITGDRHVMRQIPQGIRKLIGQQGIVINEKQPHRA